MANVVLKSEEANATPAAAVAMALTLIGIMQVLLCVASCVR